MYSMMDKFNSVLPGESITPESLDNRKTKVKTRIYNAISKLENFGYTYDDIKKFSVSERGISHPFGELYKFAVGYIIERNETEVVGTVVDDAIINKDAVTNHVSSLRHVYILRLRLKYNRNNHSLTETSM